MDSVAHPETVWAQRNDKLFLTIRLEDCSSPEVKIEADKFHFSGKGGKEQKKYAFEIEFYGEVDPQESKYHTTGREILCSIKKKEVGPYWPRLLKAGKVAFIHTDFARWRDEDDSDEEDTKAFDETNFEDMMANMGAGGGGGGESEIRAMRNATFEPGPTAFNNRKFDPGEVDDVDSDDEELPDLEG